MFTNTHSTIIIIIKIVNLKSHVLQMAQKSIIRWDDHSSSLFFCWFKSHLGVFIYFKAPYFVHFHETNSFGYICVSIGSLNQKSSFCVPFSYLFPNSFSLFSITFVDTDIWTCNSFGHTISTNSFFFTLHQNIKFIFFAHFVNIMFMRLLYHTRKIEQFNDSHSPYTFMSIQLKNIVSERN